VVGLVDLVGLIGLVNKIRRAGPGRTNTDSRASATHRQSVTRVLQGCFESVTRMLPTESRPTVPLANESIIIKAVPIVKECYKSVTRVLQECYKNVTRVLRGVTRVLRC
jgi:hypothetical protein